MRTAPGEVRWPSYLERVTGFLNQTSSRLAQTNAYAGIGAALRDWIDARANAAQSALEGATVELDAVRADRDRLHEEAAHFRSQTEGLSNELNELYKDGGVRLALKARQLRSRQT